MARITDKMMERCKLSKYEGGENLCRWCNSPLTGRQKRWCSRGCSDTAASEHWFSWSRKYALSRDGRRCVTCGKRSQLEVNHIKPAKGSHSKASCLHHLENLETLCRPCHLKITNAQRKAKG